MGHVFPFSREGQLVLSITLLLIVGFCYCSEKSVEVNGAVECSECSLNNVESSHVISGHRVAISCKVGDKKSRTRGVGEIKEGKFKVALPSDIVNDNGHLKEECFAQLQSTASITPCSSSSDEASKIVYKSTDNGKQILGLKGKLEFSPTACTSATYFKYNSNYKYPFPPYLPPYLNPQNPPLRTEPFPPLSSFPPLFGELPPNAKSTDDPLVDNKYYFLHHKKHLPPLHKFKPIPKVPIVHKKPPLHHDHIPKIPHHPLHKLPHVPLTPPDLHA